MSRKLKWEEFETNGSADGVGYRAGPFVIFSRKRLRIRGKARTVYELFIKSGPYSLAPVVDRPGLAGAKAWAQRLVYEIQKNARA